MTRSRRHALGAGLAGTSPGTAYIESAAGVSAGGRTGLTAVFVAIFFLLVGLEIKREAAHRQWLLDEHARVKSEKAATERRLKRAEALLVQFPTWCYGAPAMLAPPLAMK